MSRRFNHELVFGISVKNLTKAERLIYSDSLMTHAMILTAVTDKVTLTQPHLPTANKSKICIVFGLKTRFKGYYGSMFWVLPPPVLPFANSNVALLDLRAAERVQVQQSYRDLLKELDTERTPDFEAKTQLACCKAGLSHE